MSVGYVHATALVVGEDGVLLRGPSGVGKSAVALAVIEAVRGEGAFARLVGDDRVALEVRDGRLIARPHPAVAGLIERRGQGVESVPHLAAARVRLVVDLARDHDGLDRLPLAQDCAVVIAGVALPRLAAAGAPGEVARAIRARLRAAPPSI